MNVINKQLIEEEKKQFEEFCRNWDEKHAAEYRDQARKEAFDRRESRRNEWGDFV